jgi:hypothetical protein
MGKRSSWLRVASPSEFAATQKCSMFAAPAPETILCRLLAELQACEPGKFAAHLYRSRREYPSACERAGKSGKQIERCVISTFQVAESMGFKPMGRPVADWRLSAPPHQPSR